MQKIFFLMLFLTLSFLGKSFVAVLDGRPTPIYLDTVYTFTNYDTGHDPQALTPYESFCTLINAMVQAEPYFAEFFSCLKLDQELNGHKYALLFNLFMETEVDVAIDMITELCRLYKNLRHAIDQGYDKITINNIKNNNTKNDNFHRWTTESKTFRKLFLDTFKLLFKTLKMNNLPVGYLTQSLIKTAYWEIFDIEEKKYLLVLTKLDAVERKLADT